MKTIEDIFGRSGRMISYSKGQYGFDNPTHAVVYNSNICTEEGKIWYGDIDVTLEGEKLKEASKELGQTLYVLYEMDGRFENETKPKIDQAAFTITPDAIVPRHEEYYEVLDGVLHVKREEREEPELPEYDDSDEYAQSEYIKLVKVDYRKIKGNVEDSPLNQLDHLMLAALKEQGIDRNTVQSIYCSVETDDKIKEIVKKYLIRVHGLKDGTYALQREMSWLPLAMPSNFYGTKKGPRWVEADTMYVYLKEEPNEAA